MLVLIPKKYYVFCHAYIAHDHLKKLECYLADREESRSKSLATVYLEKNPVAENPSPRKLKLIAPSFTQINHALSLRISYKNN
nr:unnamed protein product [Callosobruchus analis]